jgi:nicotinate-nucleotide adenylyltransferase
VTDSHPTPLGIPEGCQHVVLFGGTFDPPHCAHIAMADLARQETERRRGGAALLVFVPAARSPHKASAPTANEAQRLEMLRLAVDGLEHATIWTDELDRASEGEPSYWLRTLERARQLIGDRSLTFVIGADQATSFHRWRGPREMLGLAGVLVLPREPIASARALRRAMEEAGFWKAEELDRWAESFVKVDLRKAASTEVRESQGSPFGTPLHPRVLQYARAQGLYNL